MTSLTSGLFESLENIITGQVASHFQSLYSVIFPIWTTGLIIYYLVVVFEIIYTDKQIIIMEFIKHFMVLAIISSIIGAGGFYLTDIVPFVMKSGQELSVHVLGTKTSTAGLIDGMIDKLSDIMQSLYDEISQAGFFDKIGAWFGWLVKSIFLILSGGTFVFYAMVYLIMAMLMVGILLSLGVIFIMFFAFPSTRQMATAWVGCCLNYIILNISFSILFSILIGYLNSYMEANKASEYTRLDDIMIMALVFLIGTYLLNQIAVLTSQLTGGVGISGLVSAVKDGYNIAKTGAGLGMKGAKGAGSLAKTGINKILGKGSIKGG